MQFTSNSMTLSTLVSIERIDDAEYEFFVISRKSDIIGAYISWNFPAINMAVIPNSYN